MSTFMGMIINKNNLVLDSYKIKKETEINKPAPGPIMYCFESDKIYFIHKLRFT